MDVSARLKRQTVLEAVEPFNMQILGTPRREMASGMFFFCKQTSTLAAQSNNFGPNPSSVSRLAQREVLITARVM